jgi:hypothetical protein
MLSVVCWKWTQPNYRSKFGPETVNTLRAMVTRHYPNPHRFICVTDDAKGINADIEIVPLWTEFSHLRNPSGDRNPSCYRRLRAFAPDAREYFGDRFVSVDLDVVITGDLRPVWDRPEDFVIFGDTSEQTPFNGSMFMMTAGARSQVWTSFDPVKSPRLTQRARLFGSDQAWIRHCLGKREAVWTVNDGVYSFRKHIQATGKLPADAKMVVFHGKPDPWEPSAQQLPWVKAHYCQ